MLDKFFLNMHFNKTHTQKNLNKWTSLSRFWWDVKYKETNSFKLIYASHTTQVKFKFNIFNLETLLVGQW